MPSTVDDVGIAGNPLDLRAWSARLTQAWGEQMDPVVPMRLLCALHEDNDKPRDLHELALAIGCDLFTAVSALRLLEQQSLVVGGSERQRTYFALTEGASRLLKTLSRASDTAA